MTMPLIAHRATQLAALPSLGLKLPVTVTRAIAAYQAAQEVRVPPPARGRAANLALADTAINLFTSAAERGAKTITLDPAPIARARAAEQEAIDRAALAHEVKAAAATGLCDICDRHQAALLGALRARHNTLVTGLIQHAAKLPPGVDDQVALREGGEIRESYLAARDLAAAIEQLRAAVIEVVDTPVRGGGMPGLLERGLSYVKTTAISDRMTVDGMTPWGALGSFPFFIGAAQAITDPGDWWLPTTAEVTDRAEQIMQERQIAKVKASAGR